jgi:hypothetical protein
MSHLIKRYIAQIMQNIQILCIDNKKIINVRCAKISGVNRFKKMEICKKSITGDTLPFFVIYSATIFTIFHHAEITFYPNILQMSR